MIRGTIGYRPVAAVAGAIPILLILAAGIAPERAQAARALRADFNGDGFDDLAIGAPAEGLQFAANLIKVSIPEAGVVHVLYGGFGGLQLNGGGTLPPQVFSQSMLSSGDGSEAHDHFGTSLAIGDFNGDRYDDLAIGVPGEDTGSKNEITDAGAFHVLYGSATGLSVANSEFWRQHLPGESLVSVAHSGDRLGWSLVAGNFNRDGFDDLVASAPWADCPPGICGNYPAGRPDAGVFIAWAGTAAGLDRSDERSYADANELFGYSMAAGDFNGDNCDDLAVAAPLASLGDAVREAGAVWVTPGACEGVLFGSPTIPPVQAWHQDTSGIAGVAEQYDFFGGALATGDFNADGFRDLAIGAPEESFSTAPTFFLQRRAAGVVHVLYGGSSGLSAAGSQLWTQSALGESPQNEDWFGRSLAAGDFNGDGRDDLAIGAPLESFTGAPRAGLVHVLYGTTTSGLISLFTQMWHQGLPNLGSDREPQDAFGMTLFAGDFDGDGAYDLAIGATGEDSKAGAVQVLYGPGLYGGALRLTQSTPGVGGVSEPSDWFGGALPGSRP